MKRQVSRRYTIGAATAATRIPAAMSSQKWLPVAMTETHTQTGQSSQRALRIRGRTRAASVIPTIRASAEWRLGIAAYGLDASCTRLEPWLGAPRDARVSTNPNSGNIRGGAVGNST